MSAQSIQLVMDKIAADLLAIAQAVFDDDTVSLNHKSGRNTLRDSALRNSLETVIKSSYGDNIVITELFNHYVTFLEWSRPPKYGKRPPISELKEWAASNGIDTDASTLWAISTAIWRDGHDGRPIFAMIDKWCDVYFEEWATQVYEAIMEDLDNLFN